MSNFKRQLAASLILLTSIAAGSAFAADTANHPRIDQVNDRLANQNQRIKQEVKEGEISKAKAKRLHRKDRLIKHEEVAMAKQNGGHITKTEQKILNQQENAVSRQIGK